MVNRMQKVKHNFQQDCLSAVSRSVCRLKWAELGDTWLRSCQRITFSMIFETKETLNTLEIIVVKAALVKKGFYNGGFANWRKWARGEGFVHGCHQLAELSRRLNRRRNGICRFRGQICSRFHGPFFLDTSVKDMGGLPLKGLPRGCEAQGRVKIRSDLAEFMMLTYL